MAADEKDQAAASNNLALLWRDTNRRAEAEPLMRRALIILLKFTRATGHEHPDLRAVIGNYRVIYEIDDDAGKITVLHVGHRRDVCR